MNDVTMRTPRPIPAQMPPMGLIQPPPGPGRPVSDMAWQPGYVPPTLPARRVRTKPRVPKIWLIFALLTILLLVSPAIVKFVLDLQPGDHTDNGDGTYWLYGLHLVFVIFTAPPLVALTLCVVITEGVMWMVDEWRIHGITVRLWLLPLLVVAALVGGVMYLLYGYDLVLI